MTDPQDARMEVVTLLFTTLEDLTWGWSSDPAPGHLRRVHDRRHRLRAGALLRPHVPRAACCAT
ncbi:MAG: hypothetical protein MZW92_35040 [Comamonadaceae bacterium]|nr:hypothetical protein [Comamonadaceae bacterium]